MTELKTTKRTNSRILAVQALYRNIFSEGEYDILDIISIQKEEDFTPEKYDEDLLSTLLENTSENIEHFNKIIAKHTNQDWPIERLDKVILTIIRTAICELIYSTSSATNLIIDEYTTITSYFVSGKEIDFINAILQRISAEIREKN